MKVWVLRLNGSSVITQNFRNAMRHAAVKLVPDHDRRERLRTMNEVPVLTNVGASGSFWQFLRYLNQVQDNHEFKLEEHQVGGAPGMPSWLRAIDLNDGLDPSYEVQAALWGVAFGQDSRSISDIAKAIEDDVSTRLEYLAEDVKGERELLDEMISNEERFAGLQVIPRIGKPDHRLLGLPSAAALSFLTIASDAFG